MNFRFLDHEEREFLYFILTVERQFGVDGSFLDDLKIRKPFARRHDVLQVVIPRKMSFEFGT